MNPDYSPGLTSEVYLALGSKEARFVTNQTNSRIEVSRIVDAPAVRIFMFLSHADNHPRFDTSGMVRASADHAVLDRPGMVFVMEMHDETKGDHHLEHHLVVFQPGRAIGWAPAEPGRDPAGHTFVWRLVPLDGQCTLVTQTYSHLDLGDLPPVVDREQLRISLDRLADAVTGGA